MSRPVVLFRTDASPTIGGGHLMRCLALAAAIRDRGLDPLFATAETPDAYVAPVKARSLSHVRLTASRPEDEPPELVKVASEREVAGLVLDRYGFPNRYLAEVRKRAPAWVLAQIVDGGGAKPQADLVIDQNMSARPSDYADGSTGRQVLAGSRFAMLRTEFAARPPARTISDGIARVLVTLGVSRQDVALGRIVQTAKKICSDAKITVVAGPECRLEAPDVEVLTNVSDMRAVMEGADLAVSAAGTTLWELLYMGIPTLLYTVADNQQANAAEADRQGAAVSLGSVDRFDEARLVSALRELLPASCRHQLSDRGRSVIDGRGAARVADVFSSIAAQRTGDRP